MSGTEFSGRLEATFNPFDEDYLTEILQAAAVAWARMHHPQANEIEDRITRRIAGRLANDPQFAGLPYDFVSQRSLLGLNGEILGRLDLHVKHRSSQRDYFAFEAKRLHVTYPGGRFSNEYPTYAGPDGMMAFVEGEYSKGLEAAGMLGYVMDGDSAAAWNGIDDRIHLQRELLKLSQDSKLATSPLSKAIATGMNGTHLGETDHDLDSHHLRLFHLLLPVRLGFEGIAL